MYFLIQNMTWMLYIACVVFLVLNRMEASEEEEDPDADKRGKRARRRGEEKWHDE